MPLTIEQRERDGVSILDLKGRITAGPESTALRDAIRALAATGGRQAALNLAEVDYIDSTGLGALVMCATSMRKASGSLKLVHLNRRNIELLVMTKLATVFELFTDEQDAIDSYYPERKSKAFDILEFVRNTDREE